MNYSPAVVYDLDGNFFGYVIKTQNKLQSTNVWSEVEKEAFDQRLAELNNDQDIRRFWPHPQDPSVLALLNDPNFHPIEYVDSQAIDKEHSYLVYEQIERRDIDGQPTGIFEEGDLIPESSVIRYKTIQVPKQPSDVKVRLQDAMDTVARQRLALATSS